MPHPFRKQQVDVEVECGDGRAHHFGQRMADGALHLSDDVGGAEHAGRARFAQRAVDQFRQVAAQQHVDQEHGVGNLVSVGAHGGADVRVGRFRLLLHDAGGDECAVALRGVEPFRDAGERLQVVSSESEPRRGKQPHERAAVGVVAHHVQQCDDVFYFRPFQQCRLSDDECGESGLFERVLVGGHLRFGSEQDRHVRAIVLPATGCVVRAWGVQGDRVFGEAHYGVDFLAECGVSERAERSFGGSVGVGERGDVHFAHERAAGAFRGQSQWFGQVVGRFEHHARVASGDGERVWSVGCVVAEVVLQHAERARAGASPCVDRLEWVADGVDGAAARVVHVEQGGQQGGLCGGGVLVFVEQHVRVAFAVGGADGGESGDELECGDGEIAEFRHVERVFFGVVVGHEVEQEVAFARHVGQSGGVVDA